MPYCPFSRNRPGVGAIVLGPAHAQAFSWNPDGSFSYTAQQGFVGVDAFVFKIDDLLDRYFEDFESIFLEDPDQYGIATITVNEFPESGLLALDDYFPVEFDSPDVSFELPVLDNDIGGVEIIDVSSTSEAATVWVNPAKGTIHYQPPAFPATGLSIGGVITLGEEIPVSTGYPEDTGVEGGFAPYDDTFSYTIADSEGNISTAFVQVRMQKPPEWKAKLKPAFDEKAEVGIDGQPGYNLQILQVLGENARGLPAEPMTQTWQKNTFTTLNMYVNANGEVKQDSLRNVVLLDTRSVEAGSRTPLEVTDTLGLKKALNAVNTVFIIENVSKKLG